MKGKKNKIIVHQKWYDYAEDDFKIVVSLWHNKEKINRGICFHAQQFVEKILKGILAAKQIQPPRIHKVATIYKKKV